MTDLRADRVILAGKIYPSADPTTASMGGLAIRRGRIIAVGSREHMAGLAGPGTVMDDLGDRTVLPGLVDSHIHFSQYARSLDQLDCLTSDMETCLQRVAEAAASTPPGTWIHGHGWDQNLWDRWPTVEVIDRVAPRHPVYLTARSLHAAVANTKALQRSGLDGRTIDPPQGKLGRAADGSLNGLLFEAAAMSMVADSIPKPTTYELADMLSDAQQVLWRYGLTGIHDFDGPDCFAALQLLADRGALGLRVLKAILGEYLQAAIDVGLRTGFGNDWIRTGHVKYFSDGALGPRTAAMIEPYGDDPDNRGILRMDVEELTDAGLRAHAAGLSLAIHAIGDRANRVVLDALETVHAGSEHPPLLRDRVEHLQLMSPMDIGRPARLGIIASMQPIHATSDMQMADVAWGDRVSNSYPWRSMLDSGATLVFGSDAPVESPNPFWGMHAAVARAARGTSSDPWTPQQKISLPDALHAYTLGPAQAAGSEDRTGQLRPGYLADLIVLDEDPFALPPEELYRLQPRATMVGGIWRYREI